MPVTNPSAVTIGRPVISGTVGSVLFVGASSLLQQDNANIYWDDTNNRLGIKTASPGYPLDVNGTSAFRDVPYTIATTGNNAQGLQTNQIITTSYALSKGMNFVVNGFGLMGNCYNFSQTNGGSGAFDQVEVHDGLGSFKETRASGQIQSDEYIPVDTSKFYFGSCWVKSTTLSTNNVFYFGVAPYDIDGSVVECRHVLRYPGATDTTLAAQLNNGATTMSLTSATGWNNGGSGHERNIAWYPYTNAKGYTYPDYTYSRNGSSSYSDYYANGLWAAGGISGTTVTLRSAWAGPTLANGTKVRNCYDSSTFSYCFTNGGGIAIGSSWTYCSGVIGGPLASPNYEVPTMFRPGTAFVKLLFLLNYPGSGTGNVMNYGSVYVSEVTGMNLTRILPPDTNRNSTTFFQILNASATPLFNVDTTNNRVAIVGSAPTAQLDLPASTTTHSSLRIRAGTAPSSPNDGDIWYDGTNVKVRVGAATKTFTIT